MKKVLAKNKKAPGKKTSEASLKKMLAMVSKVMEKNGDNFQTSIPFLSFMKSTQRTLLNRGMLKPSFCLILQGQKEAHIGNQVLPYGVGEYLASTIDMPAAGQIIGASNAVPYLSLRIDLDVKEMAAVVLDAKINIIAHKKSSPAAFIGQSDSDLQAAFLRLLQLLDKPQDSAFLAPGIKREILYRLLTGKNGPLLYQNLVLDQQELGVGKAVQWLKDNFHNSLKIEELAKVANMSVSSLHHKFKAVTTMGPLQYQKELRLQEARRLLLSGTVDAATAAYQVGYESHSQFSREYRRLFGAPPMKDVKNLRARSKIESLQN